MKLLEPRLGLNQTGLTQGFVAENLERPNISFDSIGDMPYIVTPKEVFRLCVQLTFLPSLLPFKRSFLGLWLVIWVPPKGKLGTWSRTTSFGDTRAPWIGEAEEKLMLLCLCFSRFDCASLSWWSWSVYNPSNILWGYYLFGWQRCWYKHFG